MQYAKTPARPLRQWIRATRGCGGGCGVCAGYTVLRAGVQARGYGGGVPEQGEGGFYAPTPYPVDRKSCACPVVGDQVSVVPALGLTDCTRP